MDPLDIVHSHIIIKEDNIDNSNTLSPLVQEKDKIKQLGEWKGKESIKKCLKETARRANDEEVDIIDNLLKEIRAGIILREAERRQHTYYKLNKDEKEKLQQIISASHAVTHCNQLVIVSPHKFRSVSRTSVEDGVQEGNG